MITEKQTGNQTSMFNDHMNILCLCILSHERPFDE